MAACSFGGGSDATPTAIPTTATPTSAPTSTVTSTATPQADVAFTNARPIELVAGRADLPSDLALIVVRGGELRRIAVPAGGGIEERLLFDPFAYSSTRLLTYMNVHTTGPALPSGQLVITACSSGDCPGLGTASEDALASVFESLDGGASWSAGSELNGVARVVSGGGVNAEALLERLPREGDGRTGRYEWWSSGRVIDPPTAWDGVTEPAVLPDGRDVWWTSDGRLVDADGRTLIDLEQELDGGSEARGIAVLARSDGAQLAVTWQEHAPGSADGPWRWSVYTVIGDRYVLSDILDAPFDAVPVAWLSDSTFLVTADLEWEALGEPASDAARPRLPVLIDVLDGTATALEVPGNTLGDGWAVAAQLGPFAEIAVGAGDCLNLRTAPSLDSGVLRCIADAALVERLTPLGSWVHVRTSDGVEGWVSGEFVRGGPRDATPAPTATATPDG